MSAFGGKADIDQYRHPRAFPGFRFAIASAPRRARETRAVVGLTAKLNLHGAFTDRDLDQAIASAIADPPSRTGSLTFPQDAMHAALVFP